MHHTDTGTVRLADSSSSIAHPPSSRLQDLQSQLTSNRLLVLVVGMSFALLAMAAVLLIQVSRESEAAERAVVHTLEVKQAATELLNLISVAESGQRGYLLTGDVQLLVPYEQGRAALESQLSELRALLADDPSQSKRLDELASVLFERFDAIEQTLSFARAGQRAEAARVVRERGEPLMRRLRTLIAQFDTAENRLLLSRQQRVHAMREQFILAVTGMLLACGLLALFALISVRRYVNAVEDSRMKLAAYNRDLEQRVAERTDALAKAAEVAERERMRAEALLTDVNHRVGNNLALVSSFLTMQQRVLKNPEASNALAAARARVQAIASAHRKLRLGTDFASVKANEVLAAVLDDIAAGLSAGGAIEVRHELAPLSIAARDAVTLGVLTSELVMNAIKHAFPTCEPGTVSVVLGVQANGTPFLEVSDDGVGWHEVHTRESQGLGERIIELVARQFGSSPERSAFAPGSKRPGTRIRVTLPKLEILG